MLEILAGAIVLCGTGSFLAHRLGRSVPAWGALCFFFGPVGLLILLLMEPVAPAQRQQAYLRPWLVGATAASCVLAGAVLGLLFALSSTGLDPVGTAGSVAESTDSSSLGPGLGIIAGGGAAVWDGFVGLFGVVAGAIVGLTGAPFVALVLSHLRLQRAKTAHRSDPTAPTSS